MEQPKSNSDKDNRYEFKLQQNKTAQQELSDWYKKTHTHHEKLLENLRERDRKR